jgi:uncharacterized membrane protein
MKLLRKYFGLILVVILGIIPLFDLLNPGFPVTHDGIDHVARIANFYQGLKEGILFPRWGGNLNWGFGHPVLMFLYPLPSYFTSLFHFFHFSLINSVKIVFGLSFIASGITMYFWARNQFNEYAGIAASALYLFAPYRFIDLYVRGALGEHVAFVFPPLVLYFTYKFFSKNESFLSYLYFIGISFSVTFLLLSHNAISLMFLPFLGVYVLYRAVVFRDVGKFTFAVIAFAVGLLLSGFFIFPAFFEGKYTLRDIVTGDEYAKRFIENPFKFLYSSWNYGQTGQFSVELGFIQLLGLLVLPFSYFKLSERKMKSFFIIVFLFFILSIFLMLPQSDFIYRIFTILKKFQFPWRFLSLSVFTLSAIGVSIFLIVKNEKYKKIILLVGILLLLVTTFPFWKAKGYAVKPDPFFTGIYNGTTDTGESSPIWSIRFMEKRPNAHLEVIDGKALIHETLRTSTHHEYEVFVESDNARFKDNTVYFPGWSVFANGQKKDIQFQDPSERGIITFSLSKGEYKVDVIFENTKLRLLSNWISVVSFAGVLMLGLFVFIKKRHEK